MDLTITPPSKILCFCDKKFKKIIQNMIDISKYDPQKKLRSFYDVNKKIYDDFRIHECTIIFATDNEFITYTNDQYVHYLTNFCYSSSSFSGCWYETKIIIRNKKGVYVKEFISKCLC